MAQVLDLGNVVGPTGAKGDTGATGPAGAKGAAGVTGSQGPKGEPGNNGATPTFSINSEGHLLATFS